MGTIRSILFCAIVLPAWSLAPAPAAACVYNPIICLGSSGECRPSPVERRAEEKRLSAEATREKLAEARKRLAAGKVDVSAELAELLVPNIRPVFLEYSDCGPMGEVDYGPGREDEKERFEALTEGTSLAGSDFERFQTMIRRREEYLGFGATCNAEFRRSFADSLRRSLDPALLSDAWTFLTARQRTHDNYGPIYHRLTFFETGTRKPPIHWLLHDDWLRSQVATALRRTRWGPALNSAMDSFWAGTGPRLDDEGFVCPAAQARWTEVRERLLTEMTARDSGRRPLSNPRR